MDEQMSIERLWARRDGLGPGARAVDPAAIRALIAQGEQEGWDSPTVQAAYRALLAGATQDEA